MKYEMKPTIPKGWRKLPIDTEIEPDDRVRLSSDWFEWPVTQLRGFVSDEVLVIRRIQKPQVKQVKGKTNERTHLR